VNTYQQRELLAKKETQAYSYFQFPLFSTGQLEIFHFQVFVKFVNMAEFDNADKHSQNSAFSFEAVYVLECMYCTNRICERGLKSFLIADEKVELFSTDRVNRR